MKTTTDKQFLTVPGEHALCFRCEHRALFLDTKTHRPRYECGDAEMGKYSCYMYEPVKPLVLEMDKGEKRLPFVGYMLSGRSHAVGLPVTKLRLKVKGKKMCLYHDPCKVCSNK